MSLQFIVKYALSLDIQFKMAAPFEKSKLFFNYKFLQKTLISLKSFKVCKFFDGKKRRGLRTVRKNVKTGKPGSYMSLF
jgi:hypothetical protein